MKGIVGEDQMIAEETEAMIHVVETEIQEIMMHDILEILEIENIWIVKGEGTIDDHEDTKITILEIRIEGTTTMILMEEGIFIIIFF